MTKWLPGKIADRIGRKPFVIAVFLSFALFQLNVTLAWSFALLDLAFIVGGLREIGEPARKAMIVDFAQENVRARSVGPYYLVRLSITPAALIGGLLSNIAPQLPFVTAKSLELQRRWSLPLLSKSDSPTRGGSNAHRRLAKRH